MKPKPFIKKKIKMNEVFAWGRKPRPNGWIKYTILSKGFHWYIQIHPNTTRRDMARQIVKEKNKFSVWREFGTKIIGVEN